MAEHGALAGQWQGPLDELPAVADDARNALRRIVPRTLVNLRCNVRDARSVAALGTALGVPLPQTPNCRAGNDNCTILWLGPDEWLVARGDGTAAALEARLRAAAADDPWLSVVDQSHNYTGLALAGPAARDVLAKGCPLDLHPRAFAADACAQTVLAGTRVLLVRTAADEFELWLRNSFARYAAAWLADAMAEFLD